MKNKKILACLLVFAMLFSLAASAASYTVVAGDMLWKIAKANGTTWQELAKLNKLKNPNLIRVGQSLTLPTGGAEGASVFEGQANGNNGKITVSVTMNGDAISAVKVLSHTETIGISDKPMAEYPKAIVANQSIKIDAVAGATNTGKGILLAVQDALTKAGADLSKFQKPVSLDKVVAPVANTSADVVVIGAGGAGMAAAVELKQAGKNVILLEKREMVGGATSLAATYFVAVETKTQVASGIKMTKEEYVQDALKKNPHMNAAAMKFMLEQSQSNIDWFVERGVDLTKPLSYYQVGLTDGSSLGVQLVKAYSKELEKVGVDFRLGSTATDILLQNGNVSGVKVETATGSYVIDAKSVILTTGGFAASNDMVKKYAPSWAGLPYTTASGSTGDGFAMAEKIGATLGYMDEVRLNPSVHTSEGASYSLSACRAAGGIMVNVEGNRFCNDYYPDYTVLSKWLMEQPGDHVYVVFDKASMDSSARVRSFDEKGFFLEGATIEELAKKMNVPAANLRTTMEKYQVSFDAGVDKEFGRTTAMVSRLDKAPFYAVSCTPGLQVTLGGINVDSRMQAMKADGTPFGGLYAAGECANEGLFGSAPTNINVTFGKVAAQSVIADQKK